MSRSVMWTTRKLSMMNVGRGFYNRASSGCTLVKQLKSVHSLIGSKPYPFRNTCLCKGEPFRTSSRRFLCSENNNKELPKARDGSEGGDSVAMEEGDDFDYEVMDRLINRFEEKVSEASFSKNSRIPDEHLEYLSNIAEGDEKTLKHLMVCYFVVKKVTEIYSIPFNMDHYHWSTWVDKLGSGLHRAIGQCVWGRIVRYNEKMRKVSRSIKDQLQFDDIYEFEPLCYHLFHNAHFLRFRSSSLNLRDRSKGVASMLYSPVIVYDCSYEEYMNNIEINTVALQLKLLIRNNLQSKLPLHIVLCNYNKDLYLYKILGRYIQNIYTGKVTITMTAKSYLDIYPRNDIVYLSPNGVEMPRFDKRKIYIVGAFVDKCQQGAISIYKAKWEGLPCWKFPIDRYVKWETGSKSLNLVHVHGIINEMFISNDWNKAFKVLPSRFITKPQPFERNMEVVNITRVIKGAFRNLK